MFIWLVHQATNGVLCTALNGSSYQVIERRHVFHSSAYSLNNAKLWWKSLENIERGFLVEMLASVCSHK